MAGNLIGLAVTGTSAVGNGTYGVAIIGAADNLVGGTTTAARNIISGNGNAGVLIANAGATGNRVQGNYIGTAQSGAAAVPNGNGGVQINSARENQIGGGSNAGEGNVISGNANHGVFITRPGPTKTSSTATASAGRQRRGPLARALRGRHLRRFGQQNRRLRKRRLLRNFISANGAMASSAGRQRRRRLRLRWQHDHFQRHRRRRRRQPRPRNVASASKSPPSPTDNELFHNLIAFNGGDGITIAGRRARASGTRCWAPESSQTAGSASTCTTTASRPTTCSTPTPAPTGCRTSTS